MSMLQHLLLGCKLWCHSFRPLFQAPRGSSTMKGRGTNMQKGLLQRNEFLN